MKQLEAKEAMVAVELILNLQDRISKSSPLLEGFEEYVSSYETLKDNPEALTAYRENLMEIAGKEQSELLGKLFHNQDLMDIPSRTCDLCGVTWKEGVPHWRYKDTPTTNADLRGVVCRFAKPRDGRNCSNPEKEESTN